MINKSVLRSIFFFIFGICSIFMTGCGKYSNTATNQLAAQDQKQTATQQQVITAPTTEQNDQDSYAENSPQFPNDPDLPNGSPNY